MGAHPEAASTGEQRIDGTPPEEGPPEGLHAQVERQHHTLATLRHKVRLMQEQTGSSDARLAASDWAMARSDALLGRHRHTSSARGGGSMEPHDKAPMSPAPHGTPGSDTSADANGDALFKQLWSANQMAFEDGDYETACDTLQAALTRARYLRDAARLMAVERKAMEQHRRLFEQTPGVSQAPPPDLHPARWEAIQLVYTSVAQQASAFMSLLQHRKRHA